MFQLTETRCPEMNLILKSDRRTEDNFHLIFNFISFAPCKQIMQLFVFTCPQLRMYSFSYQWQEGTDELPTLLTKLCESCDSLLQTVHQLTCSPRRYRRISLDMSRSFKRLTSETLKLSQIRKRHSRYVAFRH